jgi:hypothetical protein
MTLSFPEADIATLSLLQRIKMTAWSLSSKVTEK